MLNVAAMLLAIAQLAPLAGDLPPEMDPSTILSVTWLPGTADGGERAGECAVRLPRHWMCPGTDSADAGVVVIDVDNGIAAIAIVKHNSSSPGTARWGRLVRVSTPAEADRPGIGIASLRVARPPNRPNTTTFDVVSEEGVRILPVSPTAFWLSSDEVSPDAFVSVTATRHAVNDPLIVDLQPAVSIEGRIESASGEVVPDASVDLLKPFPGAPAGLSPQELKRVPLVRVGQTRSDAFGHFEFQGVSVGQYKVTVTDFARGRSETWTAAGGPLLSIQLKSPAVVTGRVIRGDLPVSDVTVRFLPDAERWRDSTDTASHLTAEVMTDDAGRFVLALPPVSDGALQLVATDGASMRVRLPPSVSSSAKAEVRLGDLRLVDPMPVEVRTDVSGCRIAAVGPAGGPGFTIVQAESRGIVHLLRLPEPGQWLMQVECAGVQRRVTPPGIEVTEKGVLVTPNLNVE